MTIACLVVILAAVLANGGMAVADFRHSSFVLANMAEVKLPRPLLPLVAGLKAAGAVGLVVGLLGVLFDRPAARDLGVAAAVGLVVFFAAALARHVQTRVLYNIYFPGAYELLAVGALVLLVAA